MIIKIILIACVLVVGWTLFRGPATASTGALRRLLACVIGLMGVLAILLPDALTWVANKVGVGRGTDLLLYILVVAFAFVAIAAWQRMFVLEERIAKLTRELALSSRNDSADRA